MKPETKAAIENVKTLAELVQQARDTARAAVIAGRPEGAVSVQEYADGPPKMGHSTARDQLNRAVELGLMEKLYAVVAGKDGKPTKMQFYREVKK